jgi:hypothetical protein
VNVLEGYLSKITPIIYKPLKNNKKAYPESGNNPLKK